MPVFHNIKQFFRNFRNLNSLERRLNVAENQISALSSSYTGLKEEQERMLQYVNTVEQALAAEKEQSTRLAQVCSFQKRQLTAMQEKNNTLQQHLLLQLADMQEVKEQLLSLQVVQSQYAARKLPIRVIFLCEHPALWNSFRSIVSAMRKETGFEVVLIRLWCKQYAEDGTFRYEALDFSEVEAELGTSLIDSYDTDNEKWLNLEAMLPDYVFFMRPYDYYRCSAYHIKKVSHYAKTCYIPYGLPTNLEMLERFSTPLEFCEYLYFYFSCADGQAEIIRGYLEGAPNLDDRHLLFRGYPPLDALREISWERKETSTFTILWLPRWNTREGVCSFFEYRDVLVDYAKQHTECHLIFRPHPLCFSNFISTGEMTKEELVELRRLYEEEPSLQLDENSLYIPSFQASDVLVADPTSLIGEYLLTGRPIIFCRKEGKLSSLFEQLLSGMYVVDTQQELCSTLDQLRQGNDFLQKKRCSLVKEYFDSGEKTSGEQICRELEKDHLNSTLSYI